MKEIHVLNLGAGVQSTTLYLMACDPASGLRIDQAVFADTQAEPKAVYRHLDWLKSLNGPPILTGTAGSLETNMLAGKNGDGGRYVSIPVFLSDDHNERNGEPSVKLGPRQCTKEYKIEVVERVIRRQLLGLKPRQRVPSGVMVYQYFGISADEAGRARRIKENVADRSKWTTPRFPLIELGWSRRGCVEWLSRQPIPHQVPRSACVFCPYRDDAGWRDMRDNDPDEFERACRMDDSIRLHGSRCNRSMRESMYLHRSCIPLRQVNLDDAKPRAVSQFTLFDCVGMCGN